MQRLATLCVIVLSFCPVPTRAQDRPVPLDQLNYVGNVYGIVKNSENGQPIGGVTITLTSVPLQTVTSGVPSRSVETNKGPRELPGEFFHPRLVGQSDYSGEFLINGVPTPYGTGRYSVIATAPGYSPQAVCDVTVRPGAVMSLRVEFQMTPGVTTWTIYDRADKNAPYRYHNEINLPNSSYRKETLTSTAAAAGTYSQNVFATHEGLVGHSTANGHVIVPNDHFVALPSTSVLCSSDKSTTFQVRLTSNSGVSQVAPVWDVGPGNIHDDYWSPTGGRQEFNDLPQGLPEKYAGFYSGYNNSLDDQGDPVRNQAGIDIADGTFADLGMSGSGWVVVDYLWAPPLIGTGEPTIATSVVISPAGPYSVGQTLTAVFTIRNESRNTAMFKVLTLGGRLNGDNSCAGGCPDFRHETNITLGENEVWRYRDFFTPSQPGTYGFFAAYQRPDGTWNTAIPTDSGVSNTATINVGGLACSGIQTPLSVPVQDEVPLTSSCTPLPPDTPSPANGSSNVGLVVQLNWSGGTSASSYQLFFGASSPPPFLATVSGTSYGIGLSPGITYFWYVVPNLSGATPSSTWSFTTAVQSQRPGTPTNLSPTNGSGNISVNPTLTWSPASGATAYQVFFGLTNPPYAAGTTSGTSYSPGQLAGNATYYWRVVATNLSGSSSTAMFSFTTTTAPVAGPVLVSGLSNPTSIAVDADSVYWVEFGGLIRKVPKGGGTPTTLFASGGNPSGIAVDSSTVYFGDGLNIRSMPKGGGSGTILAPYNPDEVAVDSMNVYWTDFNAGAVRSVPKGGGSVNTLATGSNSPAGIATDGVNVYWSEFSWPGVVRKVPITGGTPTILGHNVNNRGIAIDGSNVYWGEYIFADQGKIDKAPLAGGPTTTLAFGLNNVWDVATDGSSVFWTEDRPGGAIKQGTVTGSGPVTLADNLLEPVALAVDSSSVYWIERNGGGVGTGTLKAVPKSPTIQVSIGATPSGLAFQVDGVTYTSAQSFVWFAGTSHTISASTQPGAPGSQYSWRSWSDGGDSSHAVSPSFNSSYVAAFVTQYYFTGSATQGGTLSPATGWFDTGTVIPVSATPASGYTFAGFSGDLSSTTTPQNLGMSGPHTVNATFTPAVSYSLSGHVSLSTGAQVSGVTMTLSTGGSVQTDAAGSYGFGSLTAGGTYTVTPSMAGYTFAPQSLTFNNFSSSQTNANFVASQVAALAQATVTSTGFLYSRATHTFNGTLTVKNTGATAIAAPIQVLLTSLTPGVTLANGSGVWNGIPYITVAGSAPLDPGQSESVAVQFNNSANSVITFGPVVYSGVFQ